MLENYLLYLAYITNKLQKHFDSQKEYICCKKGCAKCCMKAQFPYSEIEFQLLYKGLLELEPDVQKEVLDNIDRTIIDKQIHNEEKPNEKFRYNCPFLINNECSVYAYRGLICRTFGLMTFKKGDMKNLNIPFCAYEGLNYSTVLDKIENHISKTEQEVDTLNPEVMAYNVDYATLLDDEIAKGFNFQFGEVKPLIEWFIKWKEELIEKINSSSVL